MAEPSKRLPRARTLDRAPETPRDPHLVEMASRRRSALGMLKGQISLSVEEALAPLDEDELRAWGLGRDV